MKTPHRGMARIFGICVLELLASTLGIIFANLIERCGGNTTDARISEMCDLSKCEHFLNTTTPIQENKHMT